MTMSRLRTINKIELWYPKYHGGRKAYIACYKVKQDNIIIFTKAKHLIGTEFYVSGDTCREYPIVTNGTIDCYAVDFSALEPVERV